MDIIRGVRRVRSEKLKDRRKKAYEAYEACKFYEARERKPFSGLLPSTFFLLASLMIVPRSAAAAGPAATQSSDPIKLTEDVPVPGGTAAMARSLGIAPT